MKKMLVIGGTGYIGHHFIKKAKKKFAITSLSLNGKNKKRYHEGVKYIKADIVNIKELRKKINKNYDFVLNAGGYGNHPDFGIAGKKLFKSHYIGLSNILKILSFARLKKFVQIGSSSEYGKNISPLKENMVCYPMTPYSISKFMCTKLLQFLYINNKTPATILRLFQVYGKDQGENRIIPFLIRNCIENKTFKTTKGEQLCDFCHINDVVSAIFKCFNSKKSNGEIINIGSGKPIKIKKIITKINKLVGKGEPKIGSLVYRKGTNMNNYPDITKAKKILKWRPKINLIEGIKDTIKKYK